VINNLGLPIINRILNEQRLKNLKIVVFGFDLISEYYEYTKREIGYIKSNAYSLGANAAASILEVIKNKGDNIIQTLYPPVFKVWPEV